MITEDGKVKFNVGGKPYEVAPLTLKQMRLLNRLFPQMNKLTDQIQALGEEPDKLEERSVLQEERTDLQLEGIAIALGKANPEITKEFVQENILNKELLPCLNAFTEIMQISAMELTSGEAQAAEVNGTAHPAATTTQDPSAPTRH